MIRRSGFSEDEVRQAKHWPTLGTYIQGKPEDLTPHQLFLKSFTYLQWRQYSAMLHGGYEGYIGELPAGAYFVLDFIPHEHRSKIEAMYDAFLTRHAGRAATILLCLVTEVQAHFRFEGADLNGRIQSMWTALMGLFEAKELYVDRYSELMRQRGIAPIE